jgi:hypothetical protein
MQLYNHECASGPLALVLTLLAVYNQAMRSQHFMHHATANV